MKLQLAAVYQDCDRAGGCPGKLPFDGVDKPHRRIPKNPFVHKPGPCCFHLGHEAHEIDDLSTNIYTRGHLDKIDAVRAQFEYSPFCDVHDGLVHLPGIPAGEGNLFDPSDQFLFSALLKDLQFPGGRRDLQSARREGTAKKHLFGVLCDINKPAATSNPRPKFRHIDIAFLIGLRQA